MFLSLSIFIFYSVHQTCNTSKVFKKFEISCMCLRFQICFKKFVVAF